MERVGQKGSRLVSLPNSVHENLWCGFHRIFMKAFVGGRKK